MSEKEREDMPVRARANACRQHVTDERLCGAMAGLADKKERAKALLLKATATLMRNCSDQLVMKCLFSDRWSEEEVAYFILQRGLKPHVMLKCRKAALGQLEGWEMPIAVDWDKGHTSLWAHEDYHLDSPGRCLVLPGWSSAQMRIDRFLDAAEIRWRGGPRLYRSGNNLEGWFVCDRPHWRTTIRVIFSKKPKNSRDNILSNGYVSDHVRRIDWGLRIQASISCDQSAFFLRQSHDFDSVVRLCLDVIQGKLVLPNFLATVVNKHIIDRYNRLVVPEADEQRLRLMLALGIHGSEHVSKDLHPLIADLLLPPPSHAFDRSAHLLLLDAAKQGLFS